MKDNKKACSGTCALFSMCEDPKVASHLTWLKDQGKQDWTQILVGALNCVISEVDSEQRFVSRKPPGVFLGSCEE